MSYWIYVTNSNNWGVTQKTNILGVSARYKNALSRVKKGDKCLVYVKGEVIAGDRIEPKLVAQYEIASTVFEDSKKLFNAPPNIADETFNFRIRLKPVEIWEKPIEFKPLVPKLAFIKNKKNWALHIRGRAIVEIPEDDYHLILRN